MLSIKSSPKYLSNDPKNIPGTLFDTNTVYKQRIPKIEIFDVFLPCLLLQTAMTNSHHVSGQAIGFYLQPSVRPPDFLCGGELTRSAYKLPKTDMGVSKNRGTSTTKSSLFNRVFHYVHHPFWVFFPPNFGWKHPYIYIYRP